MNIDKEILKTLLVKTNNEFISFDIDENISKDAFLYEFTNFVLLTNSFFYDKGVLLTSFNSLTINFNCRFDYFRKMYELAKKYNINEAIEFISDFICSYRFSLKSDKYTDLKKDVSSFYREFREYDLENEGGDINKDSLSYFKRVVNFYIDNNRKINYLLSERFFIRFKNKESFKNIFDLLIKNSDSYALLIEYDYNITVHKDIYLKYLSKLSLYTEDNGLKIAYFLDNKNILSTVLQRRILNNLIDGINVMDDKIQVSYTDDLGCFNEVINNLAYIKEKIKSIYCNYKDAVDKCVNSVLWKKRMFLKNNPVSDNLKHFVNKNELSEEQVKKIKNDIETNFPINIYSYLFINFEKELIDSRECDKENSIYSLFPKMLIDDKLGLYNFEYRKDNIFSSHYNKLDGLDNYNTMISFVGLRKRLNGRIVYDIEKEYIESNLINSCKELFEIETEINDTYVFVNLLINETLRNLKALAKELNIKYQNEKDVIKSLFIYFDNSDNKFVLKNLFYIQYILFEKDGLNLRNAYAHGDSLVYENHYVDLMYVLSALIAACLIIENI